MSKRKPGLRPQRTTEQLRVASIHVYYEVSMLMWTAERLADKSLSQGEINALLESFTIHTRALVYFFYPPPDFKDNDVLAQDFMPVSVVWSALAGPKPAVLAVHKRVGTEIAHISYGRLSLTEEARKWKVDEIAAALIQLIKTFADRAEHLDLVWPQKPTPTLDVSKLSKSPGATNVFISSGDTPPLQAPTSVNTPSTQTLIIDTSGDFPPKDGD